MSLANQTQPPFMPPRRNISRVSSDESWSSTRRILKSVLHRPWVLLASSVVIMALSYGCYRFLGTDLLPAMDEGGFILDYYTPAGSSLTESDRILRHIEEILRSVPEVENTSRRTGLQLGLAAVTEANRGDFTVRLKRKRKSRHRRDHRRCPRPGGTKRTFRESGIRAGPAGHDWRPVQ